MKTTNMTNPTSKPRLALMRKNRFLSLNLIAVILITLCCIAGCSDRPYTGSLATQGSISNTGSMLTPEDIDQYLISRSGGRVCIRKGSESICKTDPTATAKNAPSIFLYPEKEVYVFYHEGRPIFIAERPGNPRPTGNPPGGGGNPGNDGNDPTNNNPGNGGNNPSGNNPGNGGNNPSGNNPGNGGNNPSGNNPGNGGNDPTNNNPGNDGNDPTNNNPGNDGNDPTNNNPGNNVADGHGWIIWIYYPEGTAPTNPPTLSKSGATVTINRKQLTDDDITGFAKFIGPNGEQGIQFFYPTDSAELSDLKIKIEGVKSDDDEVKFTINYLWESK